MPTPLVCVRPLGPSPAPVGVTPSLCVRRMKGSGGMCVRGTWRLNVLQVDRLGRREGCETIRSRAGAALLLPHPWF